MPQIARYFLVGGTAAATDITLFFLFSQIAGLPYLPVSACSFIIATLVNYWLSIRFVFMSGVRHGKRKELALVYIVSSMGLIINQLALFFGIEFLGISPIPSKIAATGFVFIWNYEARRNLIFS